MGISCSRERLIDVLAARDDARDAAREHRDDARDAARERRDDARDAARELRDDARDAARELRDVARNAGVIAALGRIEGFLRGKTVIGLPSFKSHLYP